MDEKNVLKCHTDDPKKHANCARTKQNILELRASEDSKNQSKKKHLRTPSDQNTSAMKIICSI
jgi:hypothetical protein